jgi:hypothetical protein
MRLSSSRIHWRTAAALVAGILVGSMLITPAVGHIARIAHTWKKHFQPLADQRYVRKAQVQTGYVSCSADGWQELNSAFGEHDTLGGFLTTTSNGAVFACAVNLPHGAQVTAYRPTVVDNSSSEQLSCMLTRVSFAPDASPGTFFLLAQAETTAAGQPGKTTLEDSTIAGDPVVDNNNFGYAAQCAINGAGPDLGIVGASIQYSVNGVKGTAS